jgi:hypothetical protein
MLQTQFNKVHSLAKDDIIIRVCTRVCACTVIVGIAVSVGAVVLEIGGRRAASAHIGVVELSTATELVRIVGDARTLARNHIIATAHLQVIGTS